MVNRPTCESGSIRGLLLALCGIGLVWTLGCASGGGTDGTWGRSISGQILDPTGEPEAGVEVTLLESDVSTISDQDGYFALERVELPASTLTLQVARDGKTSQISINESLPTAEALVSVVISVDQEGNGTLQSVEVSSPASPTATPVTASTDSPPQKAHPTPIETHAPSTPTAKPKKTPPPSSPTAVPSATPTLPPVSTNTPTPAPTATPEPECVGDVNASGTVDLDDLLIVLGLAGTSQGEPGYDPDADVNNDGTIDGEDVDIVQSHFGPCP